MKQRNENELISRFLTINKLNDYRRSYKSFNNNYMYLLYRSDIVINPLPNLHREK